MCIFASLYVSSMAILTITKPWSREKSVNKWERRQWQSSHLCKCIGAIVTLLTFFPNVVEVRVCSTFQTNAIKFHISDKLKFKEAKNEGK